MIVTLVQNQNDKYMNHYNEREFNLLQINYTCTYALKIRKICL